MEIKRRIEEEILLLKIRHGDQESFVVIYDRYLDALFRFIFFRVKNEALAQDITSELFLKVWQHLTGSEHKVANLRPWLYQVARNLVADHYRTAQEELPLTEAEEVTSSGQSELSRNLSLAEVEKGLRALKGEWQEVIILAHIEGFKPSEIAPIIGKSPAATRVILHRAMQELRRILNKE